MADKSAGSNVKVVARFRPPNTAELGHDVIAFIDRDGKSVTLDVSFRSRCSTTACAAEALEFVCFVCHCWYSAYHYESPPPILVYT
jgi:hypothetical protein